MHVVFLFARVKKGLLVAQETNSAFGYSGPQVQKSEENDIFVISVFTRIVLGIYVP